jgi:shikimate 5-dehydrogenase
MFIGLGPNHPKDTYRVLDLKTKTIIITRDVRWLLKKLWRIFRQHKHQKKQYTDLENSSDEEIQIINAVNSTEEKPEPKRKEVPKSSIITRSKALFDVMKDEEIISLQSSYDYMGF